MKQTATIEEALQDFALGKGDDFPELACERSIDCIIDTVGCALAGSREDVAVKLLEAVEWRKFNGSGALLLGTRLCASGADSALYNGAACHALDFDDSAHPAYAHPSAVLVPALWSICAEHQISGREFIEAHIVGIEVFNKLGRALNKDHARFGWHPTATFGAIAAAVSVARLLRLTPVQLNMAVSIAASQAGGLRCNFGTMTKPIHAGIAARNGLWAAKLAQAGVTAIDDGLSHPEGFLQTFNRGGKIDSRVLLSWGQPLEILSEFGIALKPYPSCAAAHPATEAGILLHSDIEGRSGDIENIYISVPEFAFQSLIKEPPTSVSSARFSLEYNVAAGLQYGHVGLHSFSEDTLRDSRIARLMNLSQVVDDTRVHDDPEFAAVVKLRMRNGQEIERFVKLAPGKPGRWFDKAVLWNKYRDCASVVWDDSRTKKTYELLQSLPHVDDMRTIIASFSQRSFKEKMI